MKTKLLSILTLTAVVISISCPAFAGAPSYTHPTLGTYVQPEQTPQTISGFSQPTGANLTTMNAILNSIFTDQSYSVLNPGVDLDAIDGQIEAVDSSSLTDAVKNKLKEVLHEGKRLLADPNVFDQLTFTLPQQGVIATDQSRTRMSMQLSTLEPTGFYICPSEIITVYVDYDNGVAPTLIFGQVGDIRGSTTSSGFGAGNWRRTYSLRKGINVIQAPIWGSQPNVTSNHDTNVANASTNGFAPSAIYFSNDNAPNSQTRAPKIRLVGGTRFPLYVHGKTDDATYRKELNIYVNNMVTYTGEPNEWGTGTNGSSTKYYNIAEAASEHVILTTSATGARIAVEETGANGNNGRLHELMEAWEEMRVLYDFESGFHLTDRSSPRYRPNGKWICRAVYCLNSGVGAFATNGYTAYNVGNNRKESGSGNYQNIFKKTTIAGGTGWGYFHEVGHQYDNNDSKRGEVTNNLYSLMAQDHFQPYPKTNNVDVYGPNGSSQHNMWPKIKDGNLRDKHPNKSLGDVTEYANAYDQDGDNVWYQLTEIYQMFIVYDKEAREKHGCGLYGAMIREMIASPSKFSTGGGQRFSEKPH